MDNDNYPNHVDGAMWQPDKDRGAADNKDVVNALERAYRDGTAKTDDIIELARHYYDGADNLTAAITLLSDALSKARDQLSKIKYIYEALRAVSMSDSSKQIQLQKVLYGKLDAAIKAGGNTRAEYTAFLDCLYDALLRRDFGSLERLSSMYEALNIKENELRRYYKMIKRLEALYRNGKVHPAVETVLNPNTKRMPKNAAPLIIKQIRQIAGSLKTLRGEVPELFKKHAALEQLQNAAAMRYDLFSEFNRMEDDGAISADIKELTQRLLIIKYFGADETEVSVFKAKAEYFLNRAPLETRAAALRRMEAMYPACYRLFSDALLGGKSADELFGPEETGDEIAPYTEWHSKARRGQDTGEDTVPEDAPEEKRRPSDWQYEAPEKDAKPTDKRAPKTWEYEAPDEARKTKRIKSQESVRRETEKPAVSAPENREYEAPEEPDKKRAKPQADAKIQQPVKPAVLEEEVGDGQTDEINSLQTQGDDRSAAEHPQEPEQAIQPEESTPQNTPRQETKAPQKEAQAPIPEKIKKLKKPKEKKRRKKAAAYVPGGTNAAAGQNRGTGKTVLGLIIAAAAIAGIAVGINAFNKLKAPQSGMNAEQTQEIKALSEKYQSETGAVITVEQYKDASDEAAHAQAPADDRGFITLRITGDADNPAGVSVGLASNCLPENEFNELEKQSRDAFGDGAPVTAEKIRDFFNDAYDSLKSAYGNFPISALSNPFITYKLLKDSPEDSDMTRVPAVYGMTAEQARAKLAEYGLGINITEKDNNKYNPGRVYKQKPEFGVIAKKGDVVDVTMPPGGGTGTTVIAENSVEVPDLTGMTEDEASAAVGGLSLEISRESLADKPVGVIVSQEPAPGVALQKGATVKAVLNTGDNGIAGRVFGLMRAVAGQNYSPAQVLTYFGLPADTALSQTQTANGETAFAGSVGAPLFGLSGSVKFEMSVTVSGRVSGITCRWTPSSATTLGALGEAAQTAGFTPSRTIAGEGGYTTVYSSRQGKLSIASTGEGEDAAVEHVEFSVN